MRQQPTFWLEIRKEYVIENYSALLPYLRGYQYDTRIEADDSDFNKTFNCLKEVVDDICQSMSGDNVFLHAALQWDEDTLKKNVGLMASYLLAAQKKDLTDYHAFMSLCDILLSVEKNPDLVLLSYLKNVVTNCAANAPIVVYGFNWDDIEKIPQYSLSLFFQKAVKTTFRKPEDEGGMFYEGKGLIIMDNDGIKLLPMNKQGYDKGNSVTQFELPVGVNVAVNRADKSNKTEFPELIDTCTDMLRSLDNVVPSIKKEQKVYEDGDMVKVRVVSKKFGYVECETIDPDYEKVRGNVFIPSLLFKFYNIFSISKENLIGALQINDVLLVKKQNIERYNFYPFILDIQVFKDFNSCQIESIQPFSCDAIHLTEFSNGLGNRWLTDTGMQVNVIGELNESQRYCVDNDQPVRIHVFESKTDKNGNWIVNGRYIFEEMSSFVSSRNEFVERARNKFIENFLDYYYVEPGENQQATTRQLSPVAIPMLVNILNRCSQLVGDTTLRYLYLFAARFLAAIVSDTKSRAFLRQQMRYVECLVHFALGDETASTLNMRHDDDLPELPILSKEEAVVAQLAKYQDMDVERKQRPAEADINTAYLEEMVSASNVLRGKLEPSELNRIKKGIADYLRVADVYRNITREYTDYGEESDTLEFKTSIVFPPNNGMQADLQQQRWTILKAVCGFLNTVSGGEILLGVNDYGRAAGLKNDISYLFLHKKIGSQTMDSYRLYVKTIIDNAFRDNRNVEGLDVTSTVITYIIERNNEGDDLLRIHVNPYENGIVSFKDEHLPEGMSRSYYRTSGATVRMDDKLMKLVKQRKNL